MRHDVGQSARKHAHLAVEGDHAAKAVRMACIRRFFFDQTILIFILRDEGQWRIRDQCFGQDHWSGTRPAATMRRGECLVQVDVHGIDAQIAGADAPHNGVEVRAVAIDIATGRMHRVRNFAHIPLEKTAGVGIGNHDARNIGTKARLQRSQIHAAFRCRGNILDRITCKGRRRRIGAMRAFGAEDHRTRITARGQRRTNGKDATQFAMRPCLGRHRHGLHARQCNQPMRQFVNDC
jgi:hypothetical protein